MLWRMDGRPRVDVSASRQNTPTRQQLWMADASFAAAAASDPPPRCPAATGDALGVVGRSADGDTAMVVSIDGFGGVN